MIFHQKWKDKQNIENPQTKAYEILILTQSAKHGGLCVAGIDLDSNRLVRLVADASGKEVNGYDFRTSERAIQILDKIQIQAIEAPLKIQTENIILHKINKIIGRCDSQTANNIMSSVINNGNLLKTQDCAISSLDIVDYDKSLMIAEVRNFETKTITKIDGSQKRKARFMYRGLFYCDISITDPDYFNLKEEIQYDKCKIVLSLPEDDFNGRYFKFIAKVFPLV